MWLFFCISFTDSKNFLLHHLKQDGQLSEIARLIQQSLEQDKLKEEYLSRQAATHSSFPPSQQTAQHAQQSSPPPPPAKPPSPQCSQAVQTNTRPDENEKESGSITANSLDINNSIKQEFEAREKEHKEKIDKLQLKLKEYEKQNSVLRFEMDRLNGKCVQLSQSELQTTHELNNLKHTIQQMIDQYAELDNKFNENFNKLKLYEQR